MRVYLCVYLVGWFVECSGKYRSVGVDVSSRVSPPKSGSYRSNLPGPRLHGRACAPQEVGCTHAATRIFAFRESLSEGKFRSLAARFTFHCARCALFCKQRHQQTIEFRRLRH